MKKNKDKDPAPSSIPIVAIGASAGGMNSLLCFLNALPKEFGFALVFIQHLSAKHKSILTELLRTRRPDLRIIDISDGLDVSPSTLYICPPGKEVRLQKSVFHLSSPPKGHIHLPIDEFFVSLAGEAGERTIAVIFSGAGTDGARGIQSVRSAGGTVFVQDPATAEFAAMPLAAVNTGQADGVLPPEDIAREILKLHGTGGGFTGPGTLFTPPQYESFYRLIREKTGYRFNHYKKSVVFRRIRRRMYLHGVSSVKDYMEMVAEKDAEASMLASDIMIGVTSFFRDRLAWKALRIEAIRKLAADDEDSPIRIWAPACATGEEAYSIAMMLHDELGLAGRMREIQVFATDVNDLALERAREGQYPASIAADLPPGYMQEFFTCSEDGVSVVIGKEIREDVVFAKQDLLTDPPFSRLDLVICRNILIYLEPDAQEKCIGLFHYALKDGGYLFLGNAESAGRNNHLFKSLGHKKCRIYRKVEGSSSSRLPVSVPFAGERALSLPSQPASAAEHRQSTTEFIQETLLEEYAPAAVAINQNCDIIYHNGPTNRYLHQPRGAPSQNLLELLPENLRSRVRGGLYRAAHEAKPVLIRASLPGEGGQKRPAALRISRLRENLFVIVFREKGVAPEQEELVSSEAAAVEETAVRQLEGELSATREALQSHIEQLKSLNEELQASNEEFQAANEELETSREELQSLNEELITVNSQLQTKIEEQEETNNDLNNFLASTNIPTVFLDHRFRVRRFTPAMSKLLKLIPSDVGRPIVDMSQENLGPDLIADARVVLDNLVSVKKEIAVNGVSYIRVTLPYRTSDNRIEGVIITYTDITELKQAEERTRHIASFPQLNPNPVIEVASSGIVTFFNPATQEILENLGMDNEDFNVLLPTDLDGILRGLEKKEASSLYREIMIKDRVFGEDIYFVPQFDVVRIYARDITERKKTEEALQHSLQRFELLARTAGELLQATEPQKIVESLCRRVMERLDCHTFFNFLVDERAGRLHLNACAGIPEEEARKIEWLDYGAAICGCVARDGSRIIAEHIPTIPDERTELIKSYGIKAYACHPLLGPGGKVIGTLSFGTRSRETFSEEDLSLMKAVTDQVAAAMARMTNELALRESEERFRLLVENVRDYAIFMLDPEGRVVTWNEGAERLKGYKPEEIIGQQFSLFYPAEDVASGKPQHALETAIAEGRFEEEGWRVRKDASRFWASVVITALRDKEGAPLGFTKVTRDITERKRAEEALIESKERVRQKLESILSPEGDIGDLELGDIIDVPAIQSLVDNLYRFIHLPIGILDLKGKVLVGVGWQDICTKFHRAHPDTCRHCAESDLELTKGVLPGQFRLYKCKNGMWDAVTPVIVGGQHIGNLFWGQFFFEDEPLDREFFRAQALKYGFNEEDYLAALERVPRISREALDTGMAFYLKLSDMLSKLSYSNIKLARSLSERDTLLHSLRQSEERLKRSQEIAHLGSWELDLINNSLTWSDEVYRIFGLQPQEFGATYEAFLEAVHPDDRTAVNEAYSSSLREGRDAYEIEHRVVRRATGEIRYAHEKCEHFRDATGKIIRSVGMVHDVTERKKAEDVVLKLNEDMAARNLELEAANKELETFSYSVSHDLRAPLRSIDGFSRALLDDYNDRLDAEGRDFLERILSAIQKMGHLIDDLLNLARVSRTEMRREQVDLSEMAVRIAEGLKQAHPERGVEFIIAEGLSAYGDERLLNIVVENLIGNAWKFTENRSEAVIEFGAINCGLRIADCGFDKNSEIRNRKFAIEQSAIAKPPLHPSLEGTIYYVRDNGAGFDMTYADKLFAPFQRLHKPAEFAGTGIGLATVKRIVNRHGGHVWIEGDKDKGATVYFTLP